MAFVIFVGGFMLVSNRLLSFFGVAVASAALLAAANAADAVVSFSDLTALMSDGGSSSRAAHRQAIAAIPLQRMPTAQRQTAERCLKSTTLYRHLPCETFVCDTALLEFSLRKPEAIVDIWRTLGISQLSLDPTGAGQWRLSDGFGTVGTLRLLHCEQRGSSGVLVFHGRGGYSGPLTPKDLTGTCLLLVRYGAAQPAAESGDRQTVQIDAFLDVDGIGLEIVTRTLKPLIVHSAAANFHEICLFMQTFSAAAVDNPAAVVQLTTRLSRTNPIDRCALSSIARAAADDDAVLGPADPAAAAHLQTELASRWLPVSEFNNLHQR